MTLYQDFGSLDGSVASPRGSETLSKAGDWNMGWVGVLLWSALIFSQVESMTNFTMSTKPFGGPSTGVAAPPRTLSFDVREDKAGEESAGNEGVSEEEVDKAE